MSTALAPEHLESPAAQPPVRLMTVCTGNICRSPYAELLLQGRFDEIAPGEFEIGSAGTMGLRHKPLQTPMDTYLDAKGYDWQDFESRAFTQRMGEMADALLPLTAEHRDEILKVSPKLMKKTFTLLSFGHILQHMAESGEHEDLRTMSAKDRWTEAIARSVRLRSLATSLPTEDIDDPYRRSDEVFRRVADEIDAAVEQIVSFEQGMRA